MATQLVECFGWAFGDVVRVRTSAASLDKEYSKDVAMRSLWRTEREALLAAADRMDRNAAALRTHADRTERDAAAIRERLATTHP